MKTVTKAESMSKTLSTKDRYAIIKPFFNPNGKNMGLEKYGLVVFDNVSHYEQLACIEKNGVMRYVTGLDEFAPEVKSITDPEEKQAKIKFIRETVSKLERELISNFIDPEDEDFWSKVKLLSPQNSKFWNNISLTVGNDPIFLDKNDPHDLIKIIAIKAGGFSLVAKSYEAALDSPKPYKFYLDEAHEEAAVKNNHRIVRNKALGKLQSIYDEGGNKLFYLSKILNGATHYKKSTSRELMYEALDEYIHGTRSETAKKAPDMFLKMASKSVGELKLMSMANDALALNMVLQRKDGVYDKDTNTPIAKNKAEFIEYLKHPLDVDIAENIKKKVENYWNE